METTETSVALIRNVESNKLRWLLRLDQDHGRIHFIIARRLENESYREGVAREVAWELGLDRKKDFLVSNMAQLNFDFIGILPGRSSETCNRFTFYNVEIVANRVLEELAKDKLNFWVTSEEICNGVTEAGIPLEPYVATLIRDKGVIQAWESNSG